jgi:hypothetical protein
MCFYMQPYPGFDISSNPVVLALDRYGVLLINLKTSAVHQIVNYEDQAHYHRRAAQVQWPAKKAMDDKFRPSNIDMWQKYNDCILCDQKSIPNSQGVLL